MEGSSCSFSSCDEEEDDWGGQEDACGVIFDGKAGHEKGASSVLENCVLSDIEDNGNLGTKN